MTLIFRSLICHCARRGASEGCLSCVPMQPSRKITPNLRLLKDWEYIASGQTYFSIIKTWQALLVRFIGTFINSLFACSCYHEPCAVLKLLGPSERERGGTQRGAALCLNLQLGSDLISPTKVTAHERPFSMGPDLAGCAHMRKQPPLPN